MKYTFLGKGGSGKTTLAAATANYLSQQCLVIDADINAHINEVLDIPIPKQKIQDGFDQFAVLESKEVPQLGSYPVSDDTTCIDSVTHDILEPFTAWNDTTGLAVVGGYHAHDVNTGCYHEKLDVLEFLLHRLDEPENEHVIVDGTAGTDFAVSTLSFATDCIIFVVEPTMKSVTVCKEFMELHKQQPLQSPVHIVFNKVQTEDDFNFLSTHFTPLGSINISKDIKQFEKYGEGFDAFVEANTDVFNAITSLPQLKNDENRKEALREAYDQEWEAWGKEYFGDS